jgi:hypothetical membrane protein
MPVTNEVWKTLKALHMYIGVIAAIGAWIVIFICISINPWFVFTRDAFSDLGAPSANNPWLYNYGMIIIGLLIMVYSLRQIIDSQNKIETVGATFLFTAGIFLILIGMYPAGTRPHNFVSTWFFVQADMAILAWGIGLLARKWKDLGVLFTLMGTLGPIIAALIDWPSAATIETYGIIIIDIWVILMLKVHKTEIFR